jgi:hypothetical protein
MEGGLWRPPSFFLSGTQKGCLMPRVSKKSLTVRSVFSFGLFWSGCVLAGISLWDRVAVAQSLPAAGKSAEESRSARFLSALPDVPLMEGFEEMEADLTLFDKPDGRIAQAYALGPDVSFRSVTDYYKTILPRFGWSFEAPGAFVRNAEKLSIEIARAGGRGVIRYTLSPLDRLPVTHPARKP